MVKERIKQMLIKEVKQVRRDPRMRMVILVVPILQSLVFGYAVTTDVRHVRTAVYDTDNSVESRELISRFLGSGYFDAVERINDDEGARDALDHGRARLVIHLRHGFGEAIRAGQPAQAQLLIDGTDSNTAGLVLQYASSIATDFNRNVLVTRALGMTGATPVVQPATLQVRSWFNENLDSRNFFVPGVIALLVAVTTLLLTSMAVVREKEIGTIEQIIVTPITKTEFILGKSAPFVVIAYMNVMLVTIVSVFWFKIPIRGSILLLLGATGLYLLSMIGIGLFISTVASTQQQAMMTAFFFILPAILLSGFIFPIANMPKAVQWFTLLDPLRYFLVVIRGVFLKGVGAAVLWPQLVGLAVLGIVTLGVSVSAFRKTLG